MTADAVTLAANRLGSTGIAGARRDARLLWEYARDLQSSALVARDEGRTAALFESLVLRRVAREPLAYIVGRKEFWSLDFAVGPGVLIPRPDSETLIEQLGKAFPDRSAPLSILDLGTGSGCLLVAALTEYPNARGVGVEVSSAALAWAERNIARHGQGDRATVLEAGWLENASPGFDAVLCNPPYIPSDDIAKLEPEVRIFEPRQSLDGGADGMDAYRALAPRISRLLTPRGMAFVEIGAGQDKAVPAIFAGSRLRVAALVPDLAGISRCIVLVRDNRDV